MLLILYGTLLFMPIHISTLLFFFTISRLLEAGVSFYLYCCHCLLLFIAVASVAAALAHHQKCCTLNKTIQPIGQLAVQPIRKRTIHPQQTGGSLWRLSEQEQWNINWMDVQRNIIKEGVMVSFMKVAWHIVVRAKNTMIGPKLELGHENYSTLLGRGAHFLPRREFSSALGSSHYHVR